MCTKSTLYTLNLHNILCQLYLNKAGRNKKIKLKKEAIAVEQKIIKIYQGGLKRNKLYILEIKNIISKIRKKIRWVLWQIIYKNVQNDLPESMFLDGPFSLWLETWPIEH